MAQQTNLGTLFMEMKLRKQGFETAIKNVSKGFQKLGFDVKAADKAALAAAKSMGKAGQAVGKFGKAVGKARGPIKRTLEQMRRFLVVVGTVIVLRRFIRVLSEFETRMAEVGTIAGETTVKVTKMRQGILALSREVPQSASDLAAGAYQVLSAGVTDASDAMTVLRASAIAATAGLTDTKSAVDAITTLLNAYQLEASEAARISDVLFKTVELGKVTFGELAQNIGNVATSAALAGVSIEETAAAIATLTKFGIGAAEATTSLNRLFLTLTSQSKEQGEAFKRMGIDFSVAAVRTKGFAGLLDELNRLTDAQIERLAELFPNIRAARAAFVLAGKGIGEYNRALIKTLDSQGAARRAADRMNNTLANQGKRVLNVIKSGFIELTDPVLSGLTKAFRAFSDSFITGITTQIDLLDQYGFAWQAAATRQRQAMRLAETSLVDLRKELAELRSDQEFFLKQAVAAAKSQAGVAGAAGRGGLAVNAQIQQEGRAAQRILEILAKTEDINERRVLIAADLARLSQQGVRFAEDAANIYERQLELLDKEAEAIAGINELEAEVRFLAERAVANRALIIASAQQRLDLAKLVGDAEAEAAAKLELNLLRAQQRFDSLAQAIAANGAEFEKFVNLFSEESVAAVTDELKRDIEDINKQIEERKTTLGEILALSRPLTAQETAQKILASQQLANLQLIESSLQEQLKLLNSIVIAMQTGKEVAAETAELSQKAFEFLRDLNLANLAREFDTALGKVEVTFDVLARKAIEAFEDVFKADLPAAIEAGLALIDADNFEKIFAAAPEALKEALRTALEGLQLDPIEKLERKLESELRKLGVNAGAEATQAFEAYLEKFGDIPAHLEGDVERIRELLARAFDVSEAEMGLKEIKDKLEEALLTIDAAEAGGLDPARAEELRKEAILRSIDAAENLRFVLLDIIKNQETRRLIEEQINKFIKERLVMLGKEVKATKTGERNIKDHLRDMTTIIGLINQAVEGWVSIGQAMGTISDEMADIIDAVRQVGVGIGTIMVGMKQLEEAKKLAEKTKEAVDALPAMAAIAAGGIGALGGLVTLGASLLGGGESPADKARRVMLEKNNIAMDELKLSIDKLRGTFELTHDTIERLQKALTPTDAGSALSLGLPQGIIAQLHRFGLTIEDLERAARELGIEIWHEGQLVPRAVRQVVEGLDELKDYLVGFPDTVQGLLARFRFDVDFLDIDDPIERLTHLFELLLEPSIALQAQLDELDRQIEASGSAFERMALRAEKFRLMMQAATEAGLPFIDQLLGVDISTAEGRREAERIIEDLARQISAGTLDPSALGVATQSDAIALLREMEGLLDEIEGHTGETQNVLRSVSITELQANQLLAYQATQVVTQERIESLLEEILILIGLTTPLAIPPPGIGAAALVGEAGSQTVNIDVDLNIDSITLSGEIGEQAEMFALTAADAISRKLGERLRVSERLLGIN